jgi:hypothetical protein
MDGRNHGRLLRAQALPGHPLMDLDFIGEHKVLIAFGLAIFVVSTAYTWAKGGGPESIISGMFISGISVGVILMGKEKLKNG